MIMEIRPKIVQVRFNEFTHPLNIQFSHHKCQNKNQIETLFALFCFAFYRYFSMASSPEGNNFLLTNFMEIFSCHLFTCEFSGISPCFPYCTNVLPSKKKIFDSSKDFEL